MRLVYATFGRINAILRVRVSRKGIRVDYFVRKFTANDKCVLNEIDVRSPRENEVEYTYANYIPLAFGSE